MYNISIELSKNRKSIPGDDVELGFGNFFTDHMFIMKHDEHQGWHDPRIVPYQNIQLDPAAMVLHYGQEVFEGMKAYYTDDNRILLFRPNENFKRLNMSNKRMCIPKIDEELALEALRQLILVDKDWIPRCKGCSLYIRPFIIATDPFLGVRESKEYLFIIILSPVGSYYKEGLNPVKIHVETEFVRAIKGGVGEAKTGANYAASLKSQSIAKENNYSQVLWLDGVERKYIEEVGTMNVFFKIGDQVVTPILNGSILPGITRMSTIGLLKKWNVDVIEKRISIQEIYDSYQNGDLKEIFGTGTAAVISPVGELKWEDKVMNINNGEIGSLSQKLYDTLTGIQTGKIEDVMHWTFEAKQ